MSIRRLTRREAIAVGVSGTLAGLAGCDKDVVTTTSDAIIAIGGMAFKIPHWLGKVIGAALISGASALKIYFACADGSQKEVEIGVTEEQTRKIKKELAAGAKFTVTDPKGNKQTVEPKK